ncbi:unnamed protein product, partial [Prorocentrum cordatum]
RCLAQCAALGTEAQKHVDRLGEQAAARRQGSTWRLPKEVCGATRRRCDVLHEAFCSGLQCQLNGSGAVGVWLPLKTAAQPPPVSPGGLARSEGYLAAHMRCARRCASQQYLTVELGRPLSRAAIADAAARLEECGLVHLSGGAWPEQSLSRLQAAAAALLGLPADQQAALRRGTPAAAGGPRQGQPAARPRACEATSARRRSAALFVLMLHVCLEHGQTLGGHCSRA